MARKAREILDVFGVEIDPQATMRRLPVGLRQLVEIVKAHDRRREGPAAGRAQLRHLRARGRSASTASSTKLREQGVAMVYTTHKMEEIRALADRVVVLRDGGLVLDQPIGEVTDDDIVHAMIGRELQALLPRRCTRRADEVALQVSGLQVSGYARPVDLTVRRGEILGLAGLVGAGRTELLEAIFGVRKSTAGTVTVAGKPVKRNSPAAAITARHGPGPRGPQGRRRRAVHERAGQRLAAAPVGLHPGRLAAAARAHREGRRARWSRCSCAAAACAQQVGTLSGGNQQKVVLARWLTGDVTCCCSTSPPAGVDVGARSEIYRIITELAASGMAVVMASSDMPEILGLAHRALVMRGGGGRRRADPRRPDLADVQDSIFRLAAGCLNPGRRRTGRPGTSSPPRLRARRTRCPRRQPAADDRPAAAPTGTTARAPGPGAPPDRGVPRLAHPQLHGDRDAAGHRLLQLPQRALRHPGQRASPSWSRPPRSP